VLHALVALAAAQDLDHRPVLGPCVDAAHVLPWATPAAARRVGVSEDRLLRALVVPAPPRAPRSEPVLAVGVRGAPVRDTLGARLALLPGLTSGRDGIGVGRMDRPARIWMDGVLLWSNLE
jgi:hypothetical protein